MKRIVIIDAFSANIIFTGQADEFPAPACASVAGRLLQSAILLAEAGRAVVTMGEAGRDELGNRLVSRVASTGADIVGVDRYADGASTPSNLIFPSSIPGAPVSVIPYRCTLTEDWDCVWPRIDSSDIVMFGGYFALQRRVRQRLCEFLTMARDRGALLVYLPGYNMQLEPVVTRVMPYILENLEMAHVAITSSTDLRNLFGTPDPRSCYNDRLSFYTPLMANVDDATFTVTLLQGPRSISRTMVAREAGPLQSAIPPALFVDALLANNVTAQACGFLPLPTLEAITDATAQASLPSN